MQADACEWMLLEYVGPTTARQYARLVDEARQLLGLSDLVDATLEDLRRYLELIYPRRYAPQTQARRVSAIRLYFKARRENHGLWNDAAVKLCRPKIDDKLPAFLYLEQVNDILDQVPELGVSLRDRALLELIYATGLRLGQVVRLSVEDLRLSNCYLIHPEDGRLVLVGSRARAALEAYLDARRVQAGPLFLNRRGSRLTRRGATHAIRQVALRVGCRRLTARALRGSFLAHMLDAGVEVRHLQALIGHKRSAATERYLRVAVGRKVDLHGAVHPRA